MTDTVESLLRAKLIAREGCVFEVKLDSLGKPFVGIGHTVLAADHLRVGDCVSPAQVDAFYEADTAVALKAAYAQATILLGTPSIAFTAALADVCFQLGANWPRKFPNEFCTIVEGDYTRAADMLNGTLWQKETPERVADFQAALRALP